MQSPAARRRRLLAFALFLGGLLSLTAPLLAGVLTPGVSWLAWFARTLPSALLIASFLVWYRADKVFDRGFDPDSGDHDDDQHSTGSQ